MIAGQPESSNADPPCPHCRACCRRLLIAFLFPAAIFVVELVPVGIPFFALTELARLWYPVLVALFAAHPVYLAWFVWYSAGLRLRMLGVAVILFALSGYLLWASTGVAAGVAMLATTPS